MMENNNQNESPKCWYCQEEKFWNGDINWRKKPVIDTDLMTFKGQFWHRPCLKAYRKVRAYLANSKEGQNPLSDKLLTTRKPLALTKYARNNIISRKQ